MKEGGLNGKAGWAQTSLGHRGSTRVNVSSRRKKSLEDYFDKEIELEVFLKEKNDINNIRIIKPKNVNFYFIRQKEMLGTGHALLICREFIGNDSFIVAYPDDLVFSPIPLSQQLIEVHEKTSGSVLAGEFKDGDLSRYGIINYVKEVRYNEGINSM